MRTRAVFAVTTLFVSVAGVALVASPAYAVDTPVTVQVEGGALTISAPVAPVVAPVITAGVDAQTVEFELGTVTVGDNIGGTAGWGVSVSVADLVADEGVGTLPVAGGSYTPGVITADGIVTTTGTVSTTLATATTVATGTAASGVNSASWNPVIGLAVPAGALAGTYTSTVVHSLI